MAPPKGKKKAAPKGFDDSKFNCKEAQERYEFLLTNKAKLLDSFVVDPNRIETLGLSGVCTYFENQQCLNLLTNMNAAYKDEVCQFYGNLYEEKGVCWTAVNGKDFSFTPERLNQLIGCDLSKGNPSVENFPKNLYFTGKWPTNEEIPMINRKDLGHQYFGASKFDDVPANAYKLHNMTISDRLVYEMVHRSLLPTGGNLCEPTTATALFFFFTREGVKFNPGYAIAHHMLMVVAEKKKTNNMPYGNLITAFLKAEDPSFRFLSEPEQVKFYDEDFFKNHGWVVKDGEVVVRPPREKSKRTKRPEVEDQSEPLRALYNDMKGTIGEMVSLNKETYMLRKTYRAIQRAEARRSSFSESGGGPSTMSGQEGGANQEES